MIQAKIISENVCKIWGKDDSVSKHFLTNSLETNHSHNHNHSHTQVQSSRGEMAVRGSVAGWEEAVCHTSLLARPGREQRCHLAWRDVCPACFTCSSRTSGLGLANFPWEKGRREIPVGHVLSLTTTQFCQHRSSLDNVEATGMIVFQ